MSSARGSASPSSSGLDSPAAGLSAPPPGAPCACVSVCAHTGRVGLFFTHTGAHSALPLACLPFLLLGDCPTRFLSAPHAACPCQGHLVGTLLICMWVVSNVLFLINNAAMKSLVSGFIRKF